jgi:hypothetical protein
LNHRVFRNRLGLAILLAWIAAAAILFPLPSSSIHRLEQQYIKSARDNTRLSQQELERALQDEIPRQVQFISSRVWLEWTVKLFYVAVGIVVGLMALFRTQGWGLAAGVMSSIFLAALTLTYTSFEQPPFEAWLSWANAVLHSGSYSSIVALLLLQFVLPLFHVFILGYVFYYKPDLRSSETAIRG